MTAGDAGDEPTVFVIDDDASVREALRGLFESVGLATQTCDSVAAFRAAQTPAGPCCIVLDIRLPGQGGLEFQETLSRGTAPWETVLISAHVDVNMAVRAMKAGAVDVLTKPVREQDLLEAVNKALARSVRKLSEQRHLREMKGRHARLTERERQIMTLVAAGLLNKQIAAELDLSEATVKVHRSQMMQKMGARSVAELVRLTDLLTASEDRAG